MAGIKSNVAKELSLNSLLMSASDYRQFLQEAFVLLKKHNKNFGYAEFARRAGFASRSYPRDVMLGKKKLSSSSLSRFASALGLKGDAKVYFTFTLLVAREENQLLPENIHPSQIEEKLKRISRRLFSRCEPMKKPDNFYRYENWLLIYSSLGSLEKGASLEEIEQRTNLKPQECRTSLDLMLAEGIVRFDKEKARYFSHDHHLIFSHIGGNDFFKEVFLKAALTLNKKAQQKFVSDEHFFFHSVFSVKKSLLPQLKEDLRRTVLQYIDSSEDAEGDSLAKLTVGLIPHSQE